MASALINANPVVYKKKGQRPGDADFNEYAADLIDQLEIFDANI